MEKKFDEGPKAKERFEQTMTALFKAPKPTKHAPKKRKNKGKD
jgi:hypothetical protein